MRLKKSPPGASLSTTSSPTTSPPNTLRKPRPEATDISYTSTAFEPFPTRMAGGEAQSWSSTTSLSSLPSTTTATASVISTFKGWPISRKLLPALPSPPPLSVADEGDGTGINGSNEGLLTMRMEGPEEPADPSPRLLSPSPSLSPPSSVSPYTVTVAAPDAITSTHPFLPQRPYSMPMCTSSTAPTSSFSLGHSTDMSRRRVTTGDTTMGNTFNHIMEDSPAPMMSRSNHAADSYRHLAGESFDEMEVDSEDARSVASDRSVLHAVTVVSQGDKYTLHIHLPGFNITNLLISARRDRSLFIAANKFEDDDRSSSASTSSSRHPISDAPPPGSLASAGRFERLIRFGPDAQPNRALARFDGNTLTVTVPKAGLPMISWSSDSGSSGSPDPSQHHFVERSPRSIAMSLLKHGATSAVTADTGSSSDASGAGDLHQGWEMEQNRCSSSMSSWTGSMRSGSSLDETSAHSPITPMSEGDPAEGRQSSWEAGAGKTAAAPGSSPISQALDAMAGFSFTSPRTALTSPLPPSPTMSSKRPRSNSPDDPSSSAPYHRPHSTRSRSPPRHHLKQRGVGMDMAVPRRELGTLPEGRLPDDDSPSLETPTPWRIMKARGSGSGSSEESSGSVSSRKDYFGFPVQPQPQSQPQVSLQKADSPGHMDVDVDETMEISTSPNPSESGRTREQGLGRSAFFWKRWSGVGSSVL